MDQELVKATAFLIRFVLVANVVGSRVRQRGLVDLEWTGESSNHSTVSWGPFQTFVQPLLCGA